MGQVGLSRGSVQSCARHNARELDTADQMVRLAGGLHGRLPWKMLAGGASGAAAA